jgi:uncharacterized membrane protein YqjE
MDIGDSEQSAPRSLRGSAARLGASLLGLVRTRLELASLELAEQRDRVQQQLTLLLAAMAMFMFAVLFLASWVIAYYWDTHRLTAIAIVAVVFAGAGAALLALRSQAASVAPTPFAATIAEFERDRAMLAGRDNSPPAAPPTT